MWASQRGQRGGASSLPATSARLKPSCRPLDALEAQSAAVQLDHVARAGALVQAVDVLRDHCERHELLELGQSVVAGVGRGLLDQAEAVHVPAPHKGRVARVGGGGGELHGVVLRPQALVAVAKRRDARLLRHPGAAVDDHAARLRQARRRVAQVGRQAFAAAFGLVLVLAAFAALLVLVLAALVAALVLVLAALVGDVVFAQPISDHAVHVISVLVVAPGSSCGRDWR